MIEITGNLWDQAGMKVITTNGYVKRDGRAVMGRGCALEAALRHPTFPASLGKALSISGNHVNVFSFYGEFIFTFPVKHRWDEPADIDLIERSAKELYSIHKAFNPTTFIIPRPGCGNGGLSWLEVKPVIEPILVGDDFKVITFNDK